MEILKPGKSQGSELIRSSNSSSKSSAGFKAGRPGLSRIERAEVGDVAGKRLLDLLCHFGMDTLSWAKLGAEVTGIDISEKAIGQTRALAADLNLTARFDRCEVFDSPGQIDDTFDIVFMSWGAICWISDFPALARTVADFLAPGGFFYLLDGHPIFTALDESRHPEAGPLRLACDYQSGPEPVACDWGDYADPSKRPLQGQSYEWAHGLGRIVTSVVDAGLQIEFLHEHDLAISEALARSSKMLHCGYA